MTAPRRYRLVVDPVACDGAGNCAELFPEWITLDPWGFPTIEPGDVPTAVVEHAQRAVASCPRLALTLVHVAASVGEPTRPRAFRP